ncbi:MAG: hypothetical protein R3B54_05845 [Bdellovibrionota bacterium]
MDEFEEIFWLAFAGLSFNAFALETAYVKFDLPSGWFCELEGGIWVCSDDREPSPSRRVVLSMATLAEPSDSFTGILGFFNRDLPALYDYKAVTKKHLTGLLEVNQLVWIHSEQENADFPGYTTDYFTTLLDVRGMPLLVMVVVLGPTGETTDILEVMGNSFNLAPDTKSLLSATQFATQGHAPMPKQLWVLREFFPVRLKGILGN